MHMYDCRVTIWIAIFFLRFSIGLFAEQPFSASCRVLLVGETRASLGNNFSFLLLYYLPAGFRHSKLAVACWRTLLLLIRDLLFAV